VTILALLTDLKRSKSHSNCMRMEIFHVYFIDSSANYVYTGRSFSHFTTK